MERYEGTYLINGPPGTGKTTFLQGQVRAIVDHNRVLRRNPSVVLCSLTKTAAKEIATPKPGTPELGLESWRIGTLHAHAYRSLERPTIAETKLGEWNAERPDMALAEESSVDLDEPSSEWNPQKTAEKVFAQYTLLRSRLTPETLWPAPVMEFHRGWAAWKAKTGYLDFTDLIETCVRDIKRAPGEPNELIVDEGQDLSALEYKLIQKWGGNARSLMVAGDPYQALYEWRGAFPALFFDPSVPKDHVKVLSQSHRIPRRVHTVAMAWVRRISDYREIEYRPRKGDDADGSVARSAATWRAAEELVPQIMKHFDAGRSVMVMGACSFMLDPLAACLRKRGIPFSNPWRAKRGDWNPLRMSNANSTAHRVATFLRTDAGHYAEAARLWTLREFKAWSDLLAVNGFLERGSREEIELEAEAAPNDMVSIHDLRRWCVDGMAERVMEMAKEALGGRGTREALNWFDEQLQAAMRKRASFPLLVAHTRGVRGLTEEPKIHLGTIHSFKGGEADVAFVFPDLSPSGSKEWLSGGAARDSVIRMFYVALTRPRQRLIVCAGASQSAVNLLA